MAVMTARSRAIPRKRTGGWALAAAQGGYALWFAGCAFFAYSRYTADVPFEGFWPWLVLQTTYEVGLMIGGLSLVPSALLLAFGYARGHRALIAALLCSTLAVLATVVVSVSPAGLAVAGWLLA